MVRDSKRTDKSRGLEQNLEGRILIIAIEGLARMGSVGAR
jgi:hypothetical protein